MKTVPDYLVQRVEDMISARKYYSDFYDNGTKPYIYYLIYYNSSKNYYEVCFTVEDSSKSSVNPSGLAGFQIKNPDSAFAFRYDEEVQLYTDRATLNLTSCLASDAYFYKTNYYELNGFTNASSSSTGESIDYQPYFLLVTCAIILVFFVLIFKRRR